MDCDGAFAVTARWIHENLINCYSFSVWFIIFKYSSGNRFGWRSIYTISTKSAQMKFAQQRERKQESSSKQRRADESMINFFNRQEWRIKDGVWLPRVKSFFFCCDSAIAMVTSCLGADCSRKLPLG